MRITLNSEFLALKKTSESSISGRHLRILEGGVKLKLIMLKLYGNRKEIFEVGIKEFVITFRE